MRKHTGSAALVVALFALVLSVTGVADAAREAAVQDRLQTAPERGAQARQEGQVPGQGDPEGRERQATPTGSAPRPPPT